MYVWWNLQWNWRCVKVAKITTISITDDFEDEWKKFKERFPGRVSERLRELIALDNKNNWYDDLKKVEEKRKAAEIEAMNLREIEGKMKDARKQQTLTNDAFEDVWPTIRTEIVKIFGGNIQTWIAEGHLLKNHAKLLQMSPLQLQQKVQKRFKEESKT
jgi:hypothetical protein